MLRGRIYFGLQAVAGAGWWIAVLVSPFVREVTLGTLDAGVVAVFDLPLFVGASALASFGVRPAAWIATCWTMLVAVSIAVYATISTEAGWGVLVMAAAAAASVLALCLLVLGRVPTRWMVLGPFAFRSAIPRSSSAVAVLATFGQIVVFWGFFLIVLPLVLRFLEHRWLVAIPLPAFAAPLGAALLVLASVLGIWSAGAMSVRGNGTPLPSAMANRLVIAGPYRFVRNPMAVAGIAQGIGVGLLLSSWLVVAYALVGSLLWNYAIRPLEEADLESRFGEEFQRYRTAVRCWMPRLPQRA